jgi:hypothetical protein
MDLGARSSRTNARKWSRRLPVCNLLLAVSLLLLGYYQRQTTRSEDTVTGGQGGWSPPSEVHLAPVTQIAYAVNFPALLVASPLRNVSRPVFLTGFICGVLPRVKVLLYAAPLLAAMILLVRVRRLWAGCCRFELLQPRYVLELAGSLHRLTAPLRYKPMLSIAPGSQRPIEVATTSLGLNLSVDRAQYRGRHVHIYSLSCEDTLSPQCAHILARIISSLQHNYARFEVLHGGHGVVHILFAA